MKKIRLLFTCLLLSVTALVSAQNIRVTGTVADASTGEAIVGASVQLKGSTTVYAMTDIQGGYSISVPSNGTLVVVFLGYKTQELSVNGRSIIDVALPVDTELLDEVIVVAFGTSTKESFTGSAKVINEEKLSLSQVSNVTSALAGQVAGVQLTSANGAPGSNPTIRIRGIGSVNAGKDPLIIVDGSPYDGDMNNIAPSDIENMTVLKDAASNALYGARGANGVIMITTKKAKKGTSVVSFDAKVGVNVKALQEYVTLSDPRAYYEQHFKALYNFYTAEDGLGLSGADALLKANANIYDATNGGTGYHNFSIPENQLLIGSNGKLNPNATLGYGYGDYYIYPDNWSDYAYRKGLRQEYTLTFSGAEEKLSYYSSITYLDNQGITEKSDHNRISARLKADYQAKEWLKIGANMSYTKFKANSLGNNGSSNSTANVWAYTSQMAPIYPLFVRNADGSNYVDDNGITVLDHGNGSLALGGIPGTSRPFITDANPLLANQLNTHFSEGNAAVAQGNIDVTIVKGLTFTVNGAANLDETRYTYVYNPYYGQFRTTGGTVEVYHQRQFAWNTQQLLNYNKRFGNHNITALLGHEFYDRKFYSVGASKSKMFSQENKELDGAVVDGQGASSYQTEYNNEGYFVRAQYDFSSRFFASASFRRDASSRFHPDNRWGNFWSAGAAWIISKENWFNAPWLDELKLKASYGSQGNDNIGAYRYTDVFSIVPSDGNVSTIFSTKGNKDITWETSANANAGFEFSMLNGKISGSIEYFDRMTTDMLFSTPVAPSQGYSSVYKNVGDMSNRGVEGDFSFNIINSKNIQWSVNANVTYLKNKIVSLADNVKTSKGYDAEGNVYEGFTSGGFFITENVPMYTWYQYEYAGVDPNGKSLWYKNVTDDEGKVTGRETTNVYSEATKYLTHTSTLAPVYGGFGTSLIAYGFDFAINFTYQIGGQQMDGTYRTLMYSPTSSQSGYAYHADLLKAWTSENTSSNIPRFQYADSYSNASSTRFLTKASYLNLQNVNVGYTLPQRWTKRALMSSLRIYVAAENVFYWSARQGFDPRQSYSSSADASYYSPMRTISGGITIKF
ncbi:MAG: TonB-dependent receptor [Bacteroidales bacterium]|nr:TonB-dependent receptor [Bacteroidales bacterium]MDD3200887.1 TonB-dependent receptor [Bacteroidales bacterium]